MGVEMVKVTRSKETHLGLKVDDKKREDGLTQRNYKEHHVQTTST